MIKDERGAKHMAQRQSKTEWDKQNTTTISVKLNHKTDRDILDELTGAKATRLKELARIALQMDKAELKAVAAAAEWLKQRREMEERIAKIEGATVEIMNQVEVMRNMIRVANEVLTANGQEPIREEETK